MMNSVVFIIRFFPVWVSCSCGTWRKHLYCRTKPRPDPHTTGTHTHPQSLSYENTHTVTVHISKFVFHKCVWMSRAPWSSCWRFLKRKETRHCWVCVDLTWLWEQIRVMSESLTSHAGKHTLIYSSVCKCIYVCIMCVFVCTGKPKPWAWRRTSLSSFLTWALWDQSNAMPAAVIWASSLHRYKKTVLKGILLFWNRSLMHGNVHNAKASFVADQDRILKLNSRRKMVTKNQIMTYKLWFGISFFFFFLSNVYWKEEK